MKWRWLWVIKNRKSEYLSGHGTGKTGRMKTVYSWTPKLCDARIFTTQNHATMCCRRVQKLVDHTAYEAKGIFEISEHA